MSLPVVPLPPSSGFSSSFSVLSPFLFRFIVRPHIPFFFLLFIHRESLSLSNNGQSLTPPYPLPSRIATRIESRFLILSWLSIAANPLTLPLWRVHSPSAHNEGLNPPHFDPCRVFSHRNHRVLFRSRHALVLPCPLRRQAFLLFRSVHPPTLAPITCALAWQ